ncbi:hypothetical protein [Campylobacter canadensis]|uniref:hypothetical protein n=1 Tax=Campylobacter canadensis TaxID=449520 RepID=UPI001557EAC6|nr:hypothetical protein [Campylobacter canadensis]
MGQYVDSSLLQLANPANYKNEWQAIGDSFQKMYSDYVRNRLSQNEIDLSDLRLGYERATQDDKIRAFKLGTENLANQVEKGAIDLDIAKQTKDDKIAQEQIKTANNKEALKQNQTTSYFMPKKYQADINQTNAGASNLWANARHTNQTAMMEYDNYIMDKAFKGVRGDLNELNIMRSDFSSMNTLERNNVYLKMLDDEINNSTDKKTKNELLFKKRIANQYFSKSAKLDTQNLQHINLQGQLLGDKSYSNQKQLKEAEIYDTQNQISKITNLISQKKQELEKTNLTPNQVKTIHNHIKALEYNLQKQQEKLLMLENTPIGNFNVKNIKSNIGFDTSKLSAVEKNLFQDVEENLSNAAGLIKDIEELQQWIKKTNVNGGKVSYYGSYIFGKGNAYEFRKKMDLLKSNLFSDRGKKLRLPVDYLNKALDDTSEFWLSIENVNNQLNNIKTMLINSQTNELNRAKELNFNMYDYLSNAYKVSNKQENKIIKDYKK